MEQYDSIFLSQYEVDVVFITSAYHIVRELLYKVLCHPRPYHGIFHASCKIQFPFPQSTPRDNSSPYITSQPGEGPSVARTRPPLDSCIRRTSKTAAAAPHRCRMVHCGFAVRIGCCSAEACTQAEGCCCCCSMVASFRSMVVHSGNMAADSCTAQAHALAVFVLMPSLFLCTDYGPACDGDGRRCSCDGCQLMVAKWPSLRCWLT